MLADIVVDTNVLKHASDPRQRHRNECLRLIDLLTKRSTILLVDLGASRLRPLEGFIWSEYEAVLVPGNPGRTLLEHLLRNSRIVPQTRRVPRDVAKRIERLVRNKQDRHFVQVAWNAAERMVVSQDFDDFPPRVRRDLDRQIDVYVVDVATGCSQL